MLEFILWLWNTAAGNGEEDPMGDPEYGPLLDPSG